MRTKTDNPEAVGMHVFERAGLGKAPFRLVAVYQKHYQACAGAPLQCGGSCDFCGTGIVTMCEIVGSDGSRFKVGKECVRRTGDVGLLKAYKRSPEVREIARLKREALDARKKAEIEAMLADEVTRAALMSTPHPYAARAERGEKMLEWAEWMEKNCGAAGRHRLLKSLKAALAAHTA